MLLAAVVEALNTYPELSTLHYEQMTDFIGLVRHLKPTLSRLETPYTGTPPASLSVNIQDFLAVSLGVEDNVLKHMWAAFRHTAWEDGLSPDGLTAHKEHTKYLPYFLKHGLSRNIAFYMLYPPLLVCVECMRHHRSSKNTSLQYTLGEEVSHPITVFTAHLGIVPGIATSAYCRKCNTRYYPNYYVHTQATVRSYYTHSMTIIQTSQHYYMAVDVCEFFTSMMANSWTSATNCARIYNESLADLSVQADLPASWHNRLRMEIEDVWMGFYLHGLLNDIRERRDSGEEVVLELPHDAASQGERLRPALQARNQRMIGPGQENWSHACNLCCWISTDAGTINQLRSVVVDGVTVGHPCCAVLNCASPLDSVKDHHCPDHLYLDRVCAVLDCANDVESGFKTCNILQHRNLEVYDRMQGKAMFQLKRRLERVRAIQTNDALSSTDAMPEADQEVYIDTDGLCDGKPETGNRKLRARFGRKRTHNEELCVSSCGIILGRATFFGSEAPNGVRTFLMKLFPTPASLPGVIWHDNNCQIVAMLDNDEDEHLRRYFDNCALPVDVFHFKSKHKEGDLNCGRNCNPSIWKDLQTSEGKWRFNSSAAEQTNAWFGGFQAIVREMQVDGYNFFLDEMIKRRNRMMVTKLQAEGQAPYLIPRDEIL